MIKKLFLASACVAAVALAGCGGSEPAVAAPPLPLGQAVSVNGIEYTVTAVEQVATVGGEYTRKNASEGGVFIVVSYGIKNASGKPMEFYEKAPMHLVDPAGTEYSADLEATTAYQMSADLTDKMMSDLNPGLTTRAADVYEVASADFNPTTWTLQVEGTRERVSLQ